jgi:hypothetical protein
MMKGREYNSVNKFQGNEVSGLYGPGTFFSWILIMLSILANSALKIDDTNPDIPFGISADLLAGAVYIGATSLDLLHRSFGPQRCKRDAQFYAAAHVIWVSIVLCLALISFDRKQTTLDISPRQTVYRFLLWISMIAHLSTRELIFFNPVCIRPSLSEFSFPGFPFQPLGLSICNSFIATSINHQFLRERTKWLEPKALLEASH